MNRMIITALAVIAAHCAIAQTDAENLNNAQTALTATHNCDEAMRYLNMVTPENRLGADYLLCMGRTQDCKKNSEQAIYYYNKYLALKPGTDSVIRRVAELKDMNNQKARVNTEVVVAKNTYQSASKNRKKRHYLLDDNYYSTGLGAGKGLSGANSPYRSIFCFNASDGIVIMRNKAVLDISSTTCFLTSPNNTWFDNALSLPGGSGGLGTGFAEIITMGFNPVIFNKKNIALTAGVLAGINIYVMNANINYTGSVSIADKFSGCYGIKSNLYLGEYVMVYANLILNAASSAEITNDISTYAVPANYNMLTIGVSYKFDSWW